MIPKAKADISEIRLRTDPVMLWVAPFDSVVIQTLVFGEITQKDGKKLSGRLSRDGVQFKILEPEGGWLSKPFGFQGKDRRDFIDEQGSTLANIMRGMSQEYTLKDSVLYTAPAKPGKYTVEASLGGRTARVVVQVDEDAPESWEAEQHQFEKEEDPSPYRQLAEHYAPFLAQETWFQIKSDIPARFDFDGDWHGDNNWENLWTGSSQAYVYYAAMETASHWFLIYNVFHPRDYSDRCVIGTCHENDNEGIILTVRKDGSEFGQLQAMETLAHNNVYSFTLDPAIRAGAHNIDGSIDLYEGSHPVVFIESGGHGIYGGRSSHSRYNFANDSFAEGTGVTYVYKGEAERPHQPAQRLVSYDLLPIETHWWPKAPKESNWNQRTFEDFLSYRPAGGRPGVPYQAIGTTFFGRTEAANKAKPFWGWHDTLTKNRGLLADGQWGLDPAYAVSRNLQFPMGQEFSLDYVYNPYLGVGGGQ